MVWIRSAADSGLLIQAVSSLASSLMVALVFRERLTRTRVAGVALGLAGVLAVVLSQPGAKLSSAGIGDLMLVSARLPFLAWNRDLERG